MSVHLLKQDISYLNRTFAGTEAPKGQPEGAYYSPAYATDALNALASLKRYPSGQIRKR